jgi:glutamate racemase
MKIGIFDSGLGGLFIAKAIRKAMPEYEYVYLGDTKRVPYGNRSHETVFEFTREAVDYLFKKENCAIVIIACNTSSARALRRIQQEYLVDYNSTRKLMGESERKVLGVLIPTAEECAKYDRVGILATSGTVSSSTFPTEIKKKSHKTQVFQNAAPMLVPLIEEGEELLMDQFIKKYLKPLKSKKIEAVVLGCTHYPIIKNKIKNILGKNIKLISQDEVIPKKLKDYLTKHEEVRSKLTSKTNRKGDMKILVTDMTKNVLNLSEKWFGKNIRPILVNI